MFPLPQYINGRLMLAIIAVSLSASFYYEPSFPRSIQDNDEAFQKLEKIMKNEVDVNEKEMVKTYEELFVKNKLQDSSYWGSQLVGASLGWRAAEVYGLRTVLIYANLLRFLGLICNLGEFTFRTSYPLSASSPPSQPAPVTLEDVTFGNECGHHEYFEEVTISNETENATTAATTTVTPSPSSSSEPEEPKEAMDGPTCLSLQQTLTIYFQFLNKCFNGAFFGMSDFLGILYLYEIAPKGSKTNIHSISCLAFYFMLKATLKYCTEMVIAPKEIYTTENDIPQWLVSETLTLIAMVLQVLILRTFCVDSPSYLIHQKNAPANAKTALMELRQTNEVDKELEILETKKGLRHSLTRTTLLLTMYMIYLVFNYTYTLLGMLNAVALGIPKYICVNLYYIVNIVSFLLPLKFHKSVHLITIRNVLLYYFVFLGLGYFMVATLVPANIKFGTDLIKSRQATYAFVVMLSLFMHLISTSGLTLFTIVLVNEYNSQKQRANNITVAGIFGLFLSYFGLFIYLKGILIFYQFDIMPWVFLGLLTWLVGKYGMVRFGPAPTEPQPLEVFDSNFRLDHALQRENSMYEINLVNFMDENKQREENQQDSMEE